MSLFTDVLVGGVQVQFEDGSVLSTERAKVWAESEELPRAVASRLVCYQTLTVDVFVWYVHCVSKKTGPLLHFQITPTILVQYQQILVQRIMN